MLIPQYRIIGLISRSLIFLLLALVTIDRENSAHADEYFPSSIFELRPPHVRVSRDDENISQPRSYQSFQFFEPPPATPPQASVRLTEFDDLTLVYPSHGGSSTSGGSTLWDQVLVNGLEVKLNVFHFPLPWIGNAFVSPQETGLFLGQLSPGQYEVTVSHWYLPPSYLPDFNPESFVPPANVVIPSPNSPFGFPLDDATPAVVVPSAFQFRVVAIPEPSLLMWIVGLATGGSFAGIGSRRITTNRHG